MAGRHSSFSSAASARAHFTLRFLFEFLGAQILLATPFIFALAALGMAFSSRDRNGGTFLLAALVLPSAVYFLVHSLHDRIQGNWPCFLYPALARRRGGSLCDARIGAAGQYQSGASRDFSRFRSRPFCCWPSMRRRSSASCRSAAATRWPDYLAVGFDAAWRTISNSCRLQNHAAAILTTDYASTSLVLVLSRRVARDRSAQRRSIDIPTRRAPNAALLSQPLLYVVETRLDRHELLAQHFQSVTPIAHFDRLRGGVAIAHYVVYRVAGFAARRSDVCPSRYFLRVRCEKKISAAATSPAPTMATQGVSLAMAANRAIHRPDGANCRLRRRRRWT